MKCDSHASLLAGTFATLYFGCEPNVEVTTKSFKKIKVNLIKKSKTLQKLQNENEL
jgi:hypothetical protein